MRIHGSLTAKKDTIMKHSINEIGLRRTIELLLPQMVRTGELAKIIQSKMQEKPDDSGLAKETGNRFTDALTDADILVESFLGSFILTTFEDVAFAGEEYASDRVSKYFPKRQDVEYTITLDPVDGTLFFKDGLIIWSSILTILRHNEIVATAIYMPFPIEVDLDCYFFIAIKDEGTFFSVYGDPDSIRSDGSWSDYDTRNHCWKEKAPIIVSYHVSEEKKRQIAELGYPVVHFSDYVKGEPWEIHLPSLMGTPTAASALVKNDAPVLDWGAVGFTMGWSNDGYCNDFVIDKDLKIPLLVAANNRDLYDKLMDIMTD